MQPPPSPPVIPRPTLRAPPPQLTGETCQYAKAEVHPFRRPFGHRTPQCRLSGYSSAHEDSISPTAFVLQPLSCSAARPCRQLSHLIICYPFFLQLPWHVFSAASPPPAPQAPPAAPAVPPAVVPPRIVPPARPPPAVPRLVRQPPSPVVVPQVTAAPTDAAAVPAVTTPPAVTPAAAPDSGAGVHNFLFMCISYRQCAQIKAKKELCSSTLSDIPEARCDVAGCICMHSCSLALPAANRLHPLTAFTLMNGMCHCRQCESGSEFRQHQRVTARHWRHGAGHYQPLHLAGMIGSCSLMLREHSCLLQPKKQSFWMSLDKCGILMMQMLPLASVIACTYTMNE